MTLVITGASKAVTAAPPNNGGIGERIPVRSRLGFPPDDTYGSRVPASTAALFTQKRELPALRHEAPAFFAHLSQFYYDSHTTVRAYFVLY